MNILTFDIEEWYIEKAFHAGDEMRYQEFDRHLKGILDLLDQRGIKATFFVVGMLAKYFPDVVKRIAARGHEVGCHSNCHTWLNKMTQDEVYLDTRQAIDNIEQCIGQKVLSYRAPAFSVGNNNKWVFEVLAECGIENDASVFPASRDFGGFSDFGNQSPTVIETTKGQIREFPIVMCNLFGKRIAYSGGGYFRFFPLWFVNRQIQKKEYNICYFHIGDLIVANKRMLSRKEYEDYFKEAGTWINRYKRHLKSNFGKKTALERMNRLILSHDFISIQEASSQIDWEACPIKKM